MKDEQDIIDLKSISRRELVRKGARAAYVVPAVLAGNAVQLKHSPRTPLCADAFERAFAAAGAPAGLVQASPLEGPF